MPDVDPRAKEVRITEDKLTVVPADGRRISVPLAWYPKRVWTPPVIGLDD